MGLTLRQRNMNLDRVDIFQSTGVGVAAPGGQPNAYQEMRPFLDNDTEIVQDSSHAHVQNILNFLQNDVTQPIQPHNLFQVGGQSNELPAAAPTNPVEIKQEPASPGCSRDIKYKLKQSIVTSRKAQGKGDLPNLFSVKAEPPLTVAEVEKRERRKEQNRRAARKCRGKKKAKQDKAREEVREALRRKDHLEREVLELRGSLSLLKKQLREHVESGCCLLSQRPPVSVPGHFINMKQETSEQHIHHVTPNSSPAKRTHSSDTHVVPSISPHLVAIEMTRPETSNVSPHAGTSLNHSNAVQESCVNGPTSALIQPDISNNQILPSVIAGQPNIPAQPEYHDEVPIVKNNNLPSWDVVNLTPMDLDGFEQISEPLQHYIDSMTLNNTANMKNNLYNMRAGETTSCPQNLMDSSLESLARSSVSPNEVQPQILRQGNGRKFNSLSGFNNFKIYAPQNSVFPAPDINNNKNNGCGYNNSIFNTKATNRGSYNNVDNTPQPRQPHLQLQSPTGLAHNTTLLADFEPFRPSS